jgi:hypothetical protein
MRAFLLGWRRSVGNSDDKEKDLVEAASLVEVGREDRGMHQVTWGNCRVWMRRTIKSGKTAYCFWI